MRTLYATLLVAATVSAVAGAGADEKNSETDWKAYTSRAGRFSVRFPTAPKSETRTGGSGAPVEFLSAQVPGLAYSVNYTDMPPEAEKIPPGNVIDTVRNSLVRLTKGKLVEETYVDLKPYHGRQFRIEGKDKSTTLVRVFVVKHRVYQIRMLALADPLKPEDSAPFFDSFKLVK